MTDGSSNAPVARLDPVVRPLAPDDLEALWGLMRGLAVYEKLDLELDKRSPERLRENLFGGAWPRVEGFIAERDGRAVGYALFYGCYSSFWTRPILYLEDLFVEEAERGRGLGRALLAAVAKIAVERGCPRMDWAVLDWNAPSIEFYERLGATRSQGWHAYRITGEPLAKLASNG